MIVYAKKWWGCGLMRRWYGSALTRGIPFSLLSVVLVVLLEEFYIDEVSSWWIHPYPFSLFSFVVGFTLVFRSNFAYQRYWEGRTTLQIMSARWADAACELCAFDMGTYGLGAPDPAFQWRIAHKLSLAHAVCCQRLRRDPDLRNLHPHALDAPAPATDAAFNDAWRRARPCSNIVVLDASRKHMAEYARFTPLLVIGGVSAGEAEALAATLWERPTVAHAWVLREIVTRHQAGGLQVPAPILSRAFQNLGDGMAGFEQGRKIADTPFPFVSAQLAMFILILHTLGVPFVMVAFVPGKIFGPIMTFVGVWTYWSLNEVARDLEEPFIYDPNELPLAGLQHAFNKKLFAMAAYGFPDDERHPGPLEEAAREVFSEPCSKVDSLELELKRSDTWERSTGTSTDDNYCNFKFSV